MACSSNISNFINGTVSSYVSGQGRGYPILDLAKWVSYQSFRSPYYGAIPVGLILGQWGFEMGWSRDEFQSRYNPGNQDSLCGYSGTKDTSSGLPPGKRVTFSNVVQGVTAYANLLIAGYKHVAWGYSSGGFDNPGLQKAISCLEAGYHTNYNSGNATYCTDRQNGYALNSLAEKRTWAEAGYSGLYNTITRAENTCLNDKVYICTQAPTNLVGFSNINFS